MEEERERYAEYSLEKLRFPVGSWHLIIAKPGSGKSFLFETFLAECENWFDLNPWQKNQLIVAPGAGSIKVVPKKIREYFRKATLTLNFFKDYEQILSSCKNFDANVMIIDDFIMFSSKLVEQKLRQLLYRELRHNKLTILVAVHTVINVDLFSNFLDFAGKIIFPASNSNVRSLKKVCKVHELPPKVVDRLLREQQNIVRGKIGNAVFDCFVLDFENDIAIFNLQTAPIFRTKGRVDEYNSCIKLYDEMAGEFLLVPKEKVKEELESRSGSGFAIVEADLVPLLSKDVADAVAKMRREGATVDFSKNVLKRGSKTEQLLVALERERGKIGSAPKKKAEVV